MTPEEFRKIRKRLDLTQGKLALIMDVTTNAVQNWEYGRRRISKTTSAFVENLQISSEEQDKVSGSFGKLTIEETIQAFVKRECKLEMNSFKDDLNNRLESLNKNIELILENQKAKT